MTENDFLTKINENNGLIKRLINMYIDTPTEREDMFQEILMRCWISKDRFRGESKFSTWLYRLSLNSILTSLKKKNRLTTSPLDKELEHLPGVKNDDKSELQSRLYLAIKKLEDIDKTIITMHLDAFSNPEIADFMGISVNHCNVKLFRIKNRLETILKNK
jgi:RNA polymerase sigma-70 factor (ECF subfamily)